MSKVVKLTNTEIENVINACNRLMNEFDFIVSLDFKLTKIITTLQPHYKDYNDKIGEYKEEFAEKDEEGKIKTKENDQNQEIIDFGDDENLEAYSKKVEELRDQEVEVTLPITIRFDDFVDEQGRELKFSSDKNLRGATFALEPIIEF